MTRVGPDDFRFMRYTERGDFARGVWTLDPIDDTTASFAPAGDEHGAHVEVHAAP